jgi:hypothetical protein
LALLLSAQGESDAGHHYGLIFAASDLELILIHGTIEFSQHCLAGEAQRIPLFEQVGSRGDFRLGNFAAFPAAPDGFAQKMNQSVIAQMILLQPAKLYLASLLKVRMGH